MPRIRMCSQKVSDDVKAILKENEKMGAVRQALCRQASNLSAGWQGPASDVYMNAAGNADGVIASRIFKILTLSMGVTATVKHFEETDAQLHDAAITAMISREE